MQPLDFVFHWEYGALEQKTGYRFSRIPLLCAEAG